MDDLEQKSLEMIKRHEGYRAEPYFDSLGIVTIGIGRNIEAHPITILDINILKVHLQNKEKDPFMKWHEGFALIKIKEIILELSKKFLFWNEIGINRQSVLVDMKYCLGNKLFQFSGMITSLSVKNYDDASAHILDSAFGKQTGKRASELADIMRRG